MAKTKRVKSDSLLIPIPNWEEADQIVRRIGMLQNEISLAEMVCAERIDSAKQQLQQDTLEKHEHITRHRLSLEAFCREHRAAFGKKQSRTLQFGTVGFQRSTSLAVKKDSLQRIKDLFGINCGQFINIKETPDKDALAKLTDEDLKRIGAVRVEKETFYAEPNVMESIDVRDDGIHQG